MTADYLLTVRDLPGIPGEFPPIDYENLLVKCFMELDRDYGESILVERELNSLKQIAEYHGLETIYKKLLHSKRKIRKRWVFDGTVITNRSIILDGRALKLNNIFDAAYATKYIYCLKRETTMGNIFKTILRTINATFQSRKYKLVRYNVVDN
jgi:hypothetical protein